MSKRGTLPSTPPLPPQPPQSLCWVWKTRDPVMVSTKYISYNFQWQYGVYFKIDTQCRPASYQRHSSYCGQIFVEIFWQYVFKKSTPMKKTNCERTRYCDRPIRQRDGKFYRGEAEQRNRLLFPGWQKMKCSSSRKLCLFI